MAWRPLYPDRPPLRTHRVAVGGGHVLHVEERGAPDGLAAVLLHGGPGSGCSPLLHRFFDPARYRVVCIDQRGAGRSTPAGEVAHNTTAELLADLRQIRQRLGLARWLVVGGSWGATLAVLHALDDPAAVSALLLRSTFLARPADIEGFFRGAPAALADGWRDFGDRPPAAQRELALTWSRREQAMCGRGDAPPAPDAAELAALVARYRVQSHYLAHGCWLGGRPLADRAAAAPPVPALLLHGEADRVCPPEGAALLASRLPQAALRGLPGVGHDPAHPAMVDAMVGALDAFAANGRFVPLAVR